MCPHSLQIFLSCCNICGTLATSPATLCRFDAILGPLSFALPCLLLHLNCTRMPRPDRSGLRCFHISGLTDATAHCTRLGHHVVQVGTGVPQPLNTNCQYAPKITTHKYATFDWWGGKPTCQTGFGCDSRHHCTLRHEHLAVSLKKKTMQSDCYRSAMFCVLHVFV